MTPRLPDDVARCRPGCAEQRETCARFRVPLPVRFGSVVDGAIEWPAKPCAGYIAVSECMHQAQPAREPREAVRGL